MQTVQPIKRRGRGRPSRYGERTKVVRVPVSMVEKVAQVIAMRGYKIPLIVVGKPSEKPHG